MTDPQLALLLPDDQPDKNWAAEKLDIATERAAQSPNRRILHEP